MATFWASLLKSGFGTIVAIGALYLAISVVRTVRNGRRKAADNSGPSPAPAAGLALLGGSNPVDEMSGVGPSPEVKPVTHGQLNTHCAAMHAAAESRMESLSRSVSDTGSRIEKIDAKIDKLVENVAEVRQDVAVLKDRARRD
jgi:hypothetical protein